jgi:hypothetical protein
MIPMVFFYLKFFLTNILFSLIIGAILVYLNKNNTHNNFELMLYSLGLGPVFTVLLLYYLFVLIPRQSRFFYLAVIFLVYLVLFIVALKSLRQIPRSIKNCCQTAFATWKTTLYWGILLVILASVLVLYPTAILPHPVEGHDTLIYGNFGKIYYQEKQVSYEKVMKPRKNGFYFLGSSRPSFSLLLTWEMLLNTAVVNASQGFDLYFRSISGYYGLLIAVLVFFWLYRKNRYLALLGILVLLSGIRFFLMLVEYHLDSYRIFFLMLSWIWLAYALKKKDLFSLFLLGLFSGLMAFSHLIGLVVAVVNGAALLFFYEGNLKTRVCNALGFTALVMVFGGIHYILEMLWGSPWGFLGYVSF